MLNKTKTLLGVIGVTLCAFTANAATLRLDVAQDTTIDDGRIWPNSTNAAYITRDNTVKSMFGFDMSELQDLGPSVTVNSISFSAYFINDLGSRFRTRSLINIALGSDDSWEDTTATYSGFGSSHGEGLDQLATSDYDLGSFMTWDLGALLTSPNPFDEYLTLYLFAEYSEAYIIFEALRNETLNKDAFLTIDYTVSTVPLPAGLPLYGAGLAVMGFIGWRRKQRLAAT